MVICARQTLVFCGQRTPSTPVVRPSDSDLRHQASRPVKANLRQTVVQSCGATFLSIALLVSQPGVAAASDTSSDFDNGRSSVPEDLASSDKRAPSLGKLLSGPKKAEITNCSRKCMPGCIRGGEGAPGLGPLTLRKDMVRFKEGYRSRSYCLNECTVVCAAAITGIPAAPVAE